MLPVLSLVVLALSTVCSSKPVLGLPTGLFDRNRYSLNEVWQRVDENLAHNTGQAAFYTPLKTAGCFPALSFTPPVLNNETAPNIPLSDWWCSFDNENGFFGFSYDVSECKSKSALLTDFKRMRKDFKARYVRLYANCDDASFNDNVVSAAYQAGLGVFHLIWFGFDGGDEWMGRRDALIKTMQTNPLAPYVIRSIDVGSEPLFDFVLDPPSKLADQVKFVKSKVAKYGTFVSISEMKFGFTERNASFILKDVDMVHAHELPFFAQDATDPAHAWTGIKSDLDWFKKETNGSKKIIFTQTGWPSNTKVWPPNNKDAVASVAAEKAYAQLLDSQCATMKSSYGHGGVGWFWQIYDDNTLPGWGVINGAPNGSAKFAFAPGVNC